MNMNFYFVPARDPTSASCGIERNSCIVPLQACHPKPLCTNQLLSFTLHGWFLGAWIELHFSPQRQNLQNPGSAWDSVICDISLSSWGLFFASGRKAHATLLGTSYYLLNPGHFHLKLYFEKAKLSPFPTFSTSPPAWRWRTWHKNHPTLLLMAADMTQSSCRR